MNYPPQKRRPRGTGRAQGIRDKGIGERMGADLCGDATEHTHRPALKGVIEQMRCRSADRSGGGHLKRKS